MTRLSLTTVALAISVVTFSQRAHAQTPIADGIAEAVEATLSADPQDARPVAIEYSEGHETRAKIHKYASWATLPLLGTELWLGQKLYDDPNRTDLRGVHGAVGAGLIGFFSVQSVTGVWNLLESRDAPGHKKRLIHGLIMLAAEGGLVAAAATAPGHGINDANLAASRSTHRNIAFVSIGAGTAGYLLMLLTGAAADVMWALVLRDVAVDWASYYANHAVLRTFIAFAHVGGLVAGGGAAMVADRGILAAIRRGEIERQTLLTSVRHTHAVVLAGLAAVVISGVLLFAADVDAYLTSRLFWIKMALVVLLMINGLVLTAAERRAAADDISWGTLRWTAMASLALWFLTTLLGTGLLNMG